MAAITRSVRVMSSSSDDAGAEDRDDTAKLLIQPIANALNRVCGG